jgi:aminoglycoside phosphotransferase (APT) family kinase protein
MGSNLINQGRTAEIYDIGNNQILKLFRKSFPIQAIENEFKIANVIKDCNLPLPEFFGKIEQDDRIGLVYEYIHGQSMLRQIMQKPWAFFRYARQMAEIHSTLHQTKVEGIPCQKERLKFFINKTDELTEDIKNRIIGVLKNLDEGSYLCHGDLHPDNILFSSPERPIVIDWMTATAGIPAGDVARTKIILKYSKVPSHLPFITRISSTIFKSLLCHAYLNHYIKLTGITRQEISAWELPIAAARLFENGPKEEKDALIKFINKELKNCQA